MQMIDVIDEIKLELTGGILELELEDVIPIALNVLVPAIPSTESPLFLWNFSTAALVLLP